VLPPGVIPAEAPVEAGSGQVPSRPGALLVPGAARAAGSDAPNGSDQRRPWATVNICDTANRPNGLGVRAAMPGTGRRQLMFMRFTAQYWSVTRNAWLDVPGAGSSRWVYAGSARYATQQTGWTFEFEQPPPGTTFVMRAVVEQEWRGLERSAGSRAKHRRQGQQRRQGKQRRHGKHRRIAQHRRHGQRRPVRPAERKVRERWSHAVAAAAKRKADPRARYAIAKQRTLLTQTGLAGVDGGDPPGTSKAMCLIW
jgi:hypothetical protein